MNAPVPTHAGGVVVRTDGEPRVLLVRAKPAPHDWVLPKGHIEAGETAAETARREVIEEAGVEGEPIGPLGTLEFHTPAGKHVRALYYLMRYVKDVTPHEQRDLRWATFDEAMTLVEFDDTRALIAAARPAR